MKADKYIPNAHTAEEHLNNVLFQAANVEGWLLAEVRENAAVKAKCLLEAAELLVAHFEAEARKSSELPSLILERGTWDSRNVKSEGTI